MSEFEDKEEMSEREDCLYRIKHLRRPCVGPIQQAWNYQKISSEAAMWILLKDAEERLMEVASLIHEATIIPMINRRVANGNVLYDFEENCAEKILDLLDLIRNPDIIKFGADRDKWLAERHK